MTGKEAKKCCKAACSMMTDSSDYDQTDWSGFEAPIVTVYAVITEPTDHDQWHVTASGTTFSSGQDNNSDSPPIKDEDEIRRLLSQTFKWLSGLGEYPEELVKLINSEVVGDVTEKDQDEVTKLPERIVVQILSWVLSEEDF